MSLARSYIPAWSQLTRFGMPKFRVVRRPLLINSVLVPTGTEVGVEEFKSWARVKVLYEQCLLEPVPETIVQAPPKGVPGKLALVPERNSSGSVAEGKAFDDAVLLPAPAPELSNAEFAIPDVDVPAAIEAETDPAPPSASTPARASYFAKPNNKKRN